MCRGISYITLSAVAFLAIISLEGTSRASIILPEQPQFDLESSNPIGGGFHSVDKSKSPSQETDPNPAETLPLAIVNQGNSNGNSSPSSTGSSRGTGVGGMSLLTTSSVALPGLSPSSRVVAEQSLALPEAIGVDLLRPPQSV